MASLLMFPRAMATESLSAALAGWSSAVIATALRVDMSMSPGAAENQWCDRPTVLHSPVAADPSPHLYAEGVVKCSPGLARLCGPTQGYECYECPSGDNRNAVATSGPRIDRRNLFEVEWMTPSVSQRRPRRAGANVGLYCATPSA